MRLLSVFGLLAALAVAGCSGSPAKAVGEGCSSDAACSDLPGAYCAADGTCSRGCVVHSDCGCEAGTTNDSIDAGRCAAECVQSTPGAPGLCWRVCQAGSDCDDAQRCVPRAGAARGLCADPSPPGTSG